MPTCVRISPLGKFLNCGYAGTIGRTRTNQSIVNQRSAYVNYTLCRRRFPDHPPPARRAIHQCHALVLRTIDPARRPTLIAQREEFGDLPCYRFDIRLQGAGETVFFNP